jgi:hypothetical protein
VAYGGDRALVSHLGKYYIYIIVYYVVLLIVFVYKFYNNVFVYNIIYLLLYIYIYITYITGDGYYIPPTLFVDPPVDSFIWKEEIFGPVLCVRSFETEEEAMAVSNDSVYGLAAAVFTADKERLERCMHNLRCGIVWGNCCQPAFVQAPWGGVKKSGFGRELGKWGLEEFSSVKAMHSCEPSFKWDLW